MTIKEEENMNKKSIFKKLSKIGLLTVAIGISSSFILKENQLFAEESPLEETSPSSESGIGVKTIAELFPDEALSQAVANSLTDGNVNVILTQELINRLRYLSAYNVESLDGIEILQNLHSLFIETNLSELPDTIAELSLLEDLRYYSPRLERISENLVNLTNLRFLDIGGHRTNFDGSDIVTGLNELVIPENIGNLSNLEILYIAGTNISKIPESIGELSNLTNLSIVDTSLKDLPRSIFNLTTLTQLQIAGNEGMDFLPFSEDLAKLQELIHLDLSANSFLSLPESIGKLKKLRSLHADFNKIIDIPPSLWEFVDSEYRYIYLRFNQLTTLPEEFLSIPKKGFYDFSYNYLPSSTETDLKNLGFPYLISSYFDSFHVADESTTYTVYTKTELEELNLNKAVVIGEWPPLLSSAPPDSGAQVDDFEKPTPRYFYQPIPRDLYLHPDHEVILENCVNEEGNPVDVETYFDAEGSVNQETTVYANLRVTGKDSGIYQNTSDYAITPEKIKINLAILSHFRLIFDLNGAEGPAPKEQQVDLGAKAVAVDQPKRQNYQFLGWNLAKDGSEAMWDFDSTVMPEKDVTLYAQWKLVTQPEFPIPNTGVRYH